jgi:serine/threonine protein kinase
MSKFLRGYEPADMKPIVAPTNYYFAGYLAPEIYTHPEAADHRVDLWGIGYLVSEIHLGFGVFRQMPWDKLPRKHLGPKWELSIPSDVEVSPSCEGFLQSLMRQNPNKRPPIHSIRKLPFFAKIDWRTLCFQRGPNLKEIKFIPVRNTKSQVPSENHNSHCCHPHPSDPVENSQQLHESCLTKFDGIPCEKEKTIQPCICPPLSSEEFRHVTESEEQTFISNWTELH